ncbi:transposase, partial [Staphylococcus haemolyticus]|uniref:transposase n=1 Tax=Staphylococcus haemolyticus TaxID=1283 RepID=UPI000A0FE929
MCKSILNTLRIKDKNLNFSDEVIEKKHKGRMSLFYYAELTYQPTHCENCSTKNENFSIVKNGKKTSTITLLKIMEMPAYLELQKQRFYCKSCDSHFTAKSNIVDAHCFISNKTKLAVLDKAQEYRSQKSIAKSCLVSSMTVSRVINQAASDVGQSSFDALPEHLMMDEFKSVKNVTIDMYEPYMSLIKQLFPNAKIIIDRFHIVQSLNRALNMSRVHVMNCYRTFNRPLYNKYKSYWKLFLKPFETLEAFNYHKVHLFKEWKTEKGIINYLLGVDVELFNTYRYVHELRRLLKENQIEKFNHKLFFIHLSDVCPKLRPVIRTLRRLA